MSNFLEPIAGVLGDVVRPLRLYFSSREELQLFLNRFGWNVNVSSGDVNAINAAFAIEPLITTLLERVDMFVNDSDEERLKSTLDVLQAAQTAIDYLSHLNGVGGNLGEPFNQAAFWNELSGALVDDLIVTLLEQKHPVLFAMFHLLGIIRFERVTPTGANRIPYLRSQIDWSALPRLVARPGKQLQELYKWDIPGQNFEHARLLRTIERALLALKFPVAVTPPRTGLQRFIDLGSIETKGLYELEAFFIDSISTVDDSRWRLGFVAMPIPDLPGSTAHPTGLLFMPLLAGDLSITTYFSPGVGFKVSGALDSKESFIAKVYPHKSTLETNLATTAVDLSFELFGKPPDPFLLIGSRNGSRVELDGFRMLAGFRGTILDPEIYLDFRTDHLDSKLHLKVLPSKDGDGFLQKIIPKDGVNLAFGLTVGWSNKRGLYLGGSAGLETTLPVNIDLFGVIKIDSVYLALEAKEDSQKKESAIRAAAATTVQVKLGPVSAIVERFGLQTTLSFPERGGNLGVANLDLGFKPPNGIGLVIKAQVVTGGGYLYFDFEKEQYAGVLQLEIAQKFSLTAVGLLTTKMPDGKPGFSLLVIISVRFDPGIQLGYGFSLNGLGGLLGVNRTVTTEVLRDGLRRGALGSILFPQNVVENAPQIISNLSAIFPPAQDRFLFGPMAIIGWGGSPPILSMEIGIILELPDPVRLIILGRLSVTLPGKSDESSQAGDSGTDGENRQDAPKIKLQLDSLGIIDFGSGDISLDAYLYDSTIGPFTITGGMALRASFGAKPMFLLSVGGYHPAFQVPAGFPSVERVAIGLNKKESGVEVRLQLSAYFALTSNTVQFGAHLDLYVQIAGFVEIIGLLGFDALIQFQPFGVIASFEAMVSVKVSGLTLMAVGLQINLEGPSPWHVWGKAHFEILGIKQSAEFSAVIGRADPPPLPPPMDVENELLKELQKFSNWSSQLPAGENPLVTFRDSIPSKDPAATPPKKKVLIHPLAELHINQRLAPLNADPITKYGTTTPTGATTFTLMANVAAGVKAGSLETKDLSDWFALAQFYLMSDAQKLSAPSFEEKDSGLRVKAMDGYTCGTPAAKTISAAIWKKPTPADQQQPLKDQATDTPPPAPTTLLPQVAHLGAAGQAPIRAAGPAKYGDPSWWDRGITLAKTEYRVVGEENDGTPPKARATRRAGAPSPSSLFEEAMDEMAAIAEPGMSYSAAQARATQARQRSPRRRTWVVPTIGSKRGGR